MVGEAPKTTQEPERILLPVGGGKGGVGKSVLAANIGVGLALVGKKVVIVDGDLGGANQHALFGVRPAHTIHDFIYNRTETLSQVQVDTHIGNLKLISGAGDVPGMANLPPGQKLRVLREIGKLQAEYVVIDLGPGTNFNTLDFFSMAERGVVVTTPEVSSVIKTFSYLKGSLFRLMKKAVKGKEDETRDLVEAIADPKNPQGIVTVDDLRQRLGGMNGAGELDDLLTRFRPRLILNMVREEREIDVVENLQDLVRKNLSVELDYLGHLVESNDVRNSVNQMEPFILRSPECTATACMQQIVGKLTGSTFQLEREEDSLVVSTMPYLPRFRMRLKRFFKKITG